METITVVTKIVQDLGILAQHPARSPEVQEWKRQIEKSMQRMSTDEAYRLMIAKDLS